LTRIVLDASVALAWLVDKPVSPYAMHVRNSFDAGARGLVPALWHLEMANGLVVATRRKDLAVEDADKGMEFVEQMLVDAIESDADPVSVRHVFATARTHQLSAYDAVYLDLARRERLPLATLDQRLRAAAKTADVELFQ
jgi:predicted nucleic acid-binding protein